MNALYSTKKKKDGEPKKLGPMARALKEISIAGGKENYDNLRREEGANIVLNAILPRLERLETKIDNLGIENTIITKTKLRRVK